MRLEFLDVRSVNTVKLCAPRLVGLQNLSCFVVRSFQESAVPRVSLIFFKLLRVQQGKHANFVNNSVLQAPPV